MSYTTPAAFHQITVEIKKSRFIGWATQVTDREQAMAFLASAKQQYPDARHHCWAYLIGDPNAPKTAAMSDDGEPSGTAGKPILNVLNHKNVGDVMVIVTRYFGGIKLGAGGLVRAYSGCAEQVMSGLSVVTHIRKVSHTVSVSFADEQRVRHWLKLHNGEVSDVSYQRQVLMTVSLASDDQAEFGTFMAGIALHNSK